MNAYKDFKLKDLVFSLLLIVVAVFASGLIPAILGQGYFLFPSAIFFGASALALYIILEGIAGNMRRSHIPAIVVGVCFLFTIVMLVIGLIVKDLIYWSLGASLIFLVMIARYRFKYSSGIFVDYFLLPIVVLLSVVLNVFLPKDYGVIIDLIALAVVIVALLVLTYMIGLPFADGYFSRFKIENTKRRVLPDIGDVSYGDDGDPTELEYLIREATYAYSVSTYEHGSTIDVDISVSSESSSMASYTKSKAMDICKKWARKNNFNYSFNIKVTID